MLSKLLAGTLARVFVQQSGTTDYLNTAANPSNRVHARSKDAIDLSRFSNDDLDIIAAELENRVSEAYRRKRIRDDKLDKIKGLRELGRELGINPCQEDIDAWVNEHASKTNTSTTTSQRRLNQDRTQAQADRHPKVEPDPNAETLARSLRPRYGSKRRHSQLEQ